MHQRLMKRLVGDMPGGSETQESHMEHVQELFTRLAEAGLMVRVALTFLDAHWGTGGC